MKKRGSPDSSYPEVGISVSDDGRFGHQAEGRGLGTITCGKHNEAKRRVTVCAQAAMAFHFRQNSMFHFALYFAQSILHFVFGI